MDTLETFALTTLIPYWGIEDTKDNPIGRSTSISTGATSTSASALTTTLAVVEHNVNADTLKKIESNKSLNTYVESMSDEELEAALIKFNLLDKSTSNTKEIIK